MKPVGVGWLKENAKAGDVLGFRGAGAVSWSIEAGTLGLFSGYSHVGMIVPVHGATIKNRALLTHPIDAPAGYLLALLESTTMSDSPALLGKNNGVAVHNLVDSVAQYQGHVDCLPLVRPLYSEEYARMAAITAFVAGTDYDFRSAVRAGGLLLSELLGTIVGEDVSTLFCSELNAKMLRDIGLWYTPNVSKWSPTRLTRAIRRYGLVHKPIRIK
jgi:hypothetical protein